METKPFDFKALRGGLVTLAAQADRRGDYGTAAWAARIITEIDAHTHVCV